MSHTLSVPLHRYYLLGLVSVICAISVAPTTASAQERFHIELDIGRNAGFSPYRDDIVYVEDSGIPDPDSAAAGRSLYRPYLADEHYNWGSYVALRVLLNQLELGLSAHWFTRDSITLHHQSDDLLSRRRLRSDNTVDDSGVSYTEMAQPREVRTVRRGRGDLVLYSLGAGYRLGWRRGRLEVFAPIGMALALAHIDEPNHPYAFGLLANVGVGSSFELSKNFAVGAQARLFGLGTFEYERYDDAARHAEFTGGGSASALFSTMAYGAFNLSLIYIVR